MSEVHLCEIRLPEMFSFAFSAKLHARQGTAPVICEAAVAQSQINHEASTCFTRTSCGGNGLCVHVSKDTTAKVVVCM